MERLTELYVSNVPDEVLKELGIEDIPKEDYELVGTNHDTCKETCEKNNCLNCPIKRAIDKLAKYEDLEEQGLLLKLPCKVGDTVYSVTRDFISEYVVESIKIYEHSIQFYWKCTKGIYHNVVGFADFEIGKTVFLTEQEAQAALEKMKGE